MAKGTGRIPFFDPRNEDYLIKRPLVRGLVSRIARGLGLSRPRSWRQYLYFDQGAEPACTAYGSTTYLAAAPVHQSNPWLRALDIMALYKQIVAEDRKNGRYYAGGATVAAAMAVGKTRGFWDKYEWTYDVDTALHTIHDTSPVCAGTYWYPSMWQRDAEGIVKAPGPNDRTTDGHFYCCGAVDFKRGLVTTRQTWGDGDYKIPIDLFARLVREGGEVVMMHELKVG
jgi:hypothetical protein